ncbi:hypothetical protein ACJMK2_018498 [Sinanodonta woodiana]|uniref:Dedicator of cytokinesis protein 9 n=1 Tax=Sinanodonta woodiana TaxID=1069815 RepID=A0ABD3UDW6_SINWO
MNERKFTRGLVRKGDAAKIRETVAEQMRENKLQNVPKPVEPLDFETYIVKNKVVLHNDPQRDMLTFPHDDIKIPTPNPPKKIRTVKSTVPKITNLNACNLLVQECLHFYEDTCHMVQFKYSAYSGSYQQLPSFKKQPALQEQTFEIDAEIDDRHNDDTLNRSYSNVSMSAITKAGWLYKGPDSGGRENIISFTRQFKKRYFCVKQQPDQTYVMEFFKDERKTEAKGVIFLDCAQEVVKNSKKGKHCFEVKTPQKAYLFAAENETEMEDWIHTLDKVRTAAETLSQTSLDRGRDDVSFHEKMDEKALENSIHPELLKYAKESESMITRARQDGRQNVFSVYPNINRQPDEEGEEEEVKGDVEVFSPKLGDRFMIRLLDFRLRLQVNLGDEGHSAKIANPEPFYITFALYDTREGRKVSEDFHMDPNEPEIMAMIPEEVLLAADKLHSVEGINSAPDLNGLSSEWLLSKNKQGIFSVLQKHPDIHLFAKIEKVLQGPISQAVEPYLKGADPRLASKVHRQMKQFCTNIGHYRMPFAWAARPLSTSAHGPYDMILYKQENSKMSEEEIIKHLQDLKKPEKQSKWQIIPATFKISLHQIPANQPLENTLTPSLVPVKPFPDPPTNPPAMEIEDFLPEQGQFMSPFTSYINNLYVYPLSLKFDSQKSFTKARNISCCVEVRELDDDGTIPLKCIYSPHINTVFTTVGSTAVPHHSSTPEYVEEIKVCLPPVLHERHHLLFRFYHISCEGSKSGFNRKKDGIETPVGFSWLPLMHPSGRINFGEVALPVSTNLPPRYLAFDPLVSSRSSVVPDLKLIEGGKPLFKVKLLLRSTVHTKDQHLHNFFFHCQKMLSTSSPSVDIEVINKLKSLHAVDVSTYIQFLPTILNQLFTLVTKTTSEDVAMNTVRVLVHIVTEVQNVNQTKILEEYVKLVFRAEPVPKGSKQKTVHEELAKSLTSLLRPANADMLVISRFLQQAWFFFEVIIKSMTQFLIDGERVKMPRNERFSGDYQYRIQNLIQNLSPYIISKVRELPKETRNANHSLAYFVKMCFTLMDRGVVFQLISQYMQNFAVTDFKVLQEYKFEFLRIVCSHEHYVPLSLPLMRKGLIKSYKDIKLEDLKSDYTLSEEYRKTHYMPGLLLQELRRALSEPREIRRCAIFVLRNQLAKHSFDDRYCNKVQQGRIAALYLPFISILLDIRPRLTGEDAKTSGSAAATVAGSVSNGDITKQDPRHLSIVSTSSSSGQTTPTQKHLSMISLPDSVDGKRDSSVFDMIAGTGTHLGLKELKRNLRVSNASISSRSSTSSTDTIKDEEIEEKQPLEKTHSRQPSMTSSIAGTPAVPGKSLQYQKLETAEIKDLLICFLYILKHLPEDILLGWFNNSSEYDIIDFFSILEVCLDKFKYQGKKKIVTLSVIGDSSMLRMKASTLPSARRSVPNGSVSSSIRSVSQYGDVNVQEPSFHMPSSSEAEAMMRALLEANLSTEVGMIVLDILVQYADKFKNDLENREGENTLMRKVFDIYLSFLKTSQSESLQKHAFAVWRSFIRMFPTVLFGGNASFCGDLCYEVLRCCNSRLVSTRKEACALLYSLMKANFEFTKKTGFTRVHLQVIISVAQLIGNVVTLSNSRFQESLAVINSYASTDKTMKKSKFSNEVKDLTKRIKTVLMATAQMREHERDPEMLIDLQHSLADSYASTPELRKTWLDSMAKIHCRNKDFSEVRGFPQGCTAFRSISPNIERDESGIKDDSGMQDVQYTEDTLVEFLELAAQNLEQAERYEVIGEVYKLVIPIYENARDFEKLSQCYETLAQSYSKVIEVMQSGKRLLGKYFRVAFFGQTYFEDDDQKQYIYKEPKVTSLAELCDRLKSLYESKFGRDNVRLIMDSIQVDPASLDPKFAFIQVTYVTPYFREAELQKRVTEFERNNNINQFMFETPFTKVGKTRGEIHEQFKKRTILITSRFFPYIKKRIEITDKKEMILSPIEVAIDEMTSKVVDIREVVNNSIPDVKKLQLRLQGSVSAQVNAGPLAYAEAFLAEGKVAHYPPDKVESLKDIFRNFIGVCNDALDLNAQLITTEQKEYHESLKSGFRDIVDSLSAMFGEKILTSDNTSQRGSMTVFNLVTGVHGSSNA